MFSLFHVSQCLLIVPIVHHPVPEKVRFRYSNSSLKDVGGDQLSQTSYGMPLDGEKKKVRCHLSNCILVHAKVAIVSKKRVSPPKEQFGYNMLQGSKPRPSGCTIEESVP